MMRFRWLVVVMALVLLSACVHIENKCALPGQTQVGTCYYFLTIQDVEKKPDGTYVVKGQVAQAAVEKNRLVKLGWLGLFEVEDYKQTDYTYFPHSRIPVADSVAAQLKPNEDRWFVSKSGTDLLDPYTPDTPEVLAQILKEYPSTKQWDSHTEK
jgi:hypothetical protein